MSNNNLIFGVSWFVSGLVGGLVGWGRVSGLNKKTE